MNVHPYIIVWIKMFKGCATIFTQLQRFIDPVDPRQLCGCNGMQPNQPVVCHARARCQPRWDWAAHSWTDINLNITRQSPRMKLSRCTSRRS